MTLLCDALLAALDQLPAMAGTHHPWAAANADDSADNDKRNANPEERPVGHHDAKGADNGRNHDDRDGGPGCFGVAVTVGDGAGGISHMRI